MSGTPYPHPVAENPGCFGQGDSCRRKRRIQPGVYRKTKPKNRLTGNRLRRRGSPGSVLRCRLGADPRKESADCGANMHGSNNCRRNGNPGNQSRRHRHTDRPVGRRRNHRLRYRGPVRNDRQRDSKPSGKPPYANHNIKTDENPAGFVRFFQVKNFLANFSFSAGSRSITVRITPMADSATRG